MESKVRKWYKHPIFIIVCIFIFLSVIINIFIPPPKVESDQQIEVEVGKTSVSRNVINLGDIFQINSEFKNNGPAFLKKYRGNYLEFKATVVEVAEMGLQYRVEVDYGAGNVIGVACYFNRDEEESIIQISKGQTVLINGLPSQSDFGSFLQFHECKITDFNPDNQGG